MLLELARDTIARAEEDPTQPIPVVFNLSSWAEERQSIAEWLVEELNVKYNIPKRIARPWVENDDLLLLLDGLDEVKQEHRDACVEAINGFRQEHGLAPVVICSRVADYEALTTRLKLQGAVLLQSLTSQQADQYLEGEGTELLAVRRTLQHDATLQGLAQSPLMLSIMTLAYRGISVEDLGSLDTVEARRRHVFDAYVRRMFERRGAEQPCSPEQTIRWLVWLARKMTQHAQSTFLIERVQSSWLQTESERRLYATRFRWLVSGVIGVMGGTVGTLALGPNYGVLCGLSAIAFPWYVARTAKEDISTADTLKWSWAEAGRGLIRTTLIWLPVLLTMLILDLLFGPLSSLTIGLSVTLILLVSSVLFYGLFRGLRGMEVEAKTAPNQGIRWSIRNSVVVGLIVMLFGWLFLKLISELSSEPEIMAFSCAIYVGMLPWFFFRVPSGGLAVVQHYVLRFILYRSGQAPWNLAHFLDYAAERIFLRKVGGGYIFVHRLLQEHFAAMSAGEAM